MVDQTAKRRLGGVLAELDNLYSPITLDVRAENAYSVAVRLFSLIQKMITDPEDQRRLMSAWFKSVRDSDFKKFKRALRRYDRQRKGEPPEPEETE